VTVYRPLPSRSGPTGFSTVTAQEISGRPRVQVGEPLAVAVVVGLILAFPPTKACVHRASSLAVVALAMKPLGAGYLSYR
jgi:hypothetical protein